MITQTEFTKMLTGAEIAELRARYPWAKLDDGKMSRHARALLWETSFAPGAEYAGVRYMTPEEHQQSPVGVFAVVLFK